MGPLSDQPRIREKRIIRKRQAIAQTLCAHPDQIKQVMRKFIRLPRADNTLSLVWNEKTMFLPGTIEQGNPTVIEQIEEVFESGIFLGFELDQQFGVVPWQDTERTGESHERDSHCGGIG